MRNLFYILQINIQFRLAIWKCILKFRNLTENNPTQSYMFQIKGLSKSNINFILSCHVFLVRFKWKCISHLEFGHEFWKCILEKTNQCWIWSNLTVGYKAKRVKSYGCYLKNPKANEQIFSMTSFFMDPLVFLLQGDQYFIRFLFYIKQILKRGV